MYMIRMAVVPILSSGVSPQHVVLNRVSVDPVPFASDKSIIPDHAYCCPSGVPVFTTRAAIDQMGRPASSSRGSGDERVLSVFFDFDNIGTGADDILFVGIAYGQSTRKHPIIAVAVSGKMTIPCRNVSSPGDLMGKRIAFGTDTARYGSSAGPLIAVPSERTSPNSGGDLCRAVAQSVGHNECTILLG